MSKWQPNEESYPLVGEALPGQQLKIESDRPLRCSLGTCQRELSDGRPFLILVAGQRGAVMWHLSCIGINPAGDFNEAAYRQHVAQRILAGLRSS